MDSTKLKRIACACMVGDHCAWLWLSQTSLCGVVLHLFGRITFPVMAFMCCQGYIHTHNVRRYCLRMLIFAVLSDVPFMVFEGSAARHCVIFSLLGGLLAIWIADKISILASLPVVLISTLVPFDWGFIGVLLPLLFWFLRDRDKWQAIFVPLTLASALSVLLYGQIWQLGILLSVLLLFFYNGCRGSGSKYGFYIFYPAQFLVLTFIKAVI